MAETATETDISLNVRMPNLWNVKILNDDFTPMDFVIDILMTIFNKSEIDALDMTLRVHHEGSAIVGTYTKDIALTKVAKAMKRAEAEEHPLRLVPEQSS